MTVATELADLVWENPDVREQFFTLYPSLTSLPRSFSGVEDRFTGPVQGVLPYEEAIASWASGEVGYFGVVPRKEPTTGSRLVEVIEHYWGLWVDLDDADGLEAVERELRPLEFWPSAIINTGSRGHHLYFRLATSLPLPQIELYNRALAELVGGDAGYPPMPATYLRIPGSVHERSGGTAQLVEMSGAAYGENALHRLNAGLVPVLEPMMEKFQRDRRAAQHKLDRTLATLEEREQKRQRRASERHLRFKRKQKRLAEIREELDRRQKRLAETREKLDRRARALDAQRKAREPLGGNGRRPAVAQRLRRRLARLVRALVPTRSAS